MMGGGTKENIRRLLIDWREAKATQWGIDRMHDQFCARNSLILHDIFVDRISENARNIHSPTDLKKYAFYWKWIDIYGQELYGVLKEYLERPKRIANDDDLYTPPQTSMTHMPKRIRTEV